MKRLFILLYGVTCYVLGAITTIYAIGFLGNFLVPKSIDSPATQPTVWAILIDSGLLIVFALQHSIMARPLFKKWLTKVIPEPMERSTYVLASSLALGLLFWQWQPFGKLIWDVTKPIGLVVLHSLAGIGWFTMFASSLLINHFDMFGLRQVWLYFGGRDYTPISFRKPGLYRFVRHPLYVGWLIVFWATPTVGISHLVFSISMTCYILLAIRWEERDLTQALGNDYVEYKNNTGMLIPRFVQSETSRQNV